ncbi:hypothetical protein [Lewinella sp. LCG006]|uniref:hypothetical protein n=1 Tax=Lewinella sp. LCG006 TaxID=3231911 RepID=UPI0034609B59
MNGAHWHLVLNHLPIIIPMVGLLIMLVGFFLESDILKRAAFGIFILGALSAIVAFSTGEGAEEVIEGIAGIDEQLIKIHEEAAEIFAILLYVLGGISLIGLWANWKKQPFSKIIAVVTIVFSLVVLFYAKQTGTTGGEIRHTEIRADGFNGTSNVNQNMEYETDGDD